MMRRRPLDFSQINAAALAALPALCARWLPGGKRMGQEFVSLNPTRADKQPGSFKINLHTGRWADPGYAFQIGDHSDD